MNPLLLPVVAAQGLWVRYRTEVLPEAAGPANGTVGDGAHQSLRVGVIGESTAAGCGVDRHEEGFAGSLAFELAARNGQPVSWEVVGQNAATARRIRYRLLPRLGQDLDIAVLLAGVNDVLTRRRPEEWRDDLAAIVGDLAGRAKKVAVTGIPPFNAFPSLPGTLGRVLTRHAAVLDDVARQVCVEYPQATWISSTDIVPVGPEFFARDRFHPSVLGYRIWSQAVADRLVG